MSGYYCIGYCVPDRCWMVSEHQTAADAARKAQDRRTMGPEMWRGLVSNTTPFKESQVREVVDHLHASLLSSLGEARASIRRLGDAGYVPLPEVSA